MAATIGAAATMSATLEPGRAPVGVAMILATLWGAAPLVALLCARPGEDEVDPVADDAATSPEALSEDHAPVTTVIRVGDEPDELLAGSVALARDLGPVAIVGRRPDTDLGDDVLDHCEVPVGEALRSIALAATTPAVLIVSGRVAVRPEGARRAAAPIDGGVGWVTGTTRSFNDDRFVPERRELIGARLRQRARAIGLTLWEPDATVVATSLLVEDAPSTGRPYGRWLRGRAAAGGDGALTDAEPAVRAAPVSPRDHWPDALARQRATAADLADALLGRGRGSGGVRGRCVAASLLLRELYAWPLLVWLAAPVLLSAGLPFRLDPAPGAAVLVCLAVARWATLRHALGVPLTPQTDVLAAVSGLPGSLWALPAAASRRLRRHRRSYPSRPLTWLALLCVVMTGLGLVRVEPGTPGSRTVSLLCIALLVGLWILTVRMLVERNWERSSFRLPVALAATVDGRTGRIVDAGPAGVAIALDDDSTEAGPTAGKGDAVVVELEDAPAAAPLRLQGVVRSRRRRTAGMIVGVELLLDGGERARWFRRLARAASAPTDLSSTSPTSEDGSHAAPRPRPRPRVAAMIDRAAVAVVVAVSLVVVAALLLVLLGFRPLVIRSGSMAPTYQPGDIVITDRIRAADIAPGDVISLDHHPPIGEGMTHRVRSVRADDTTVEVLTKGDANDHGETWTAATEQRVGRVVATVPSIGRLAVLVRTSWTMALVASSLVAVIVLVILFGRGRPRPPRQHDADDVDDPLCGRRPAGPRPAE